MQAFKNATNFVIHNLSQTEIGTSDITGFTLLQDHVVTEAAHNSGERYDAPKCHPETRTAVLSSIKSWVDSSKDTQRIMWLHGPAGAGKSAIAQTTAEDCEKEGKLAASFFFSRPAKRNKKDGLIATIAYQLCVSIPAVKEQVVKNIERNPQIFTANIKTQMHSLVVEPLRWLGVEPLSHVRRHRSTSIIPRLVIIDGLDECEIRKDQVEIIESVSTSLSLVDSISGLRILLVSRPELEIRRAFNKDNISPLCSRIVLDDSFDPDKDIELYLRSHFQTIRREHTLQSLLPDSWPSNDSIQKLIAKSSGQFIYASTVIHFISDLEYDPRKRLDIILQIRPAENDDKPYAQLDALYSAILSMCRNYKKVAEIFEAIMFTSRDILESIQDLEAFLKLKDEIMLLLANLHSIVDMNNKDIAIRFYHASLFDFLIDSSRSHGFYIDKHEAQVRLSMRCLDFLSDPPLESSKVFKYSVENCFTLYRQSGWDDRILDYICVKKVLNLDNRQLQRTYETYYNYRSGMSMLGSLVKTVIHRKDCSKKNLRDIIDTHIIDHLYHYPRQDILFILYHATGIGGIELANNLHRNSEETFNQEYMSIMGRDLFANAEWVNDTIRNWVNDMIRHTRYMEQLPQDVPSRAICCALEFAVTSRWSFIYDERPIIENIIANLPLSREISYVLLEKWNSLSKEFDYPWQQEVISDVDTIVQSYCKVEEHLGNKSDHVTEEARDPILVEV